MKGTVIVLGATLIAAVIASIESPTPDSPENADLSRPAGSPAQDNKPPEPSYTAVEPARISSPTVTPSASAIPEPISEK